MTFDFNRATAEEVRAEAKRREDQRKGVTSYKPAELKRQQTVLENEVQQRVIKLYVRHGCKVRVYSQPRKAKYMTPGGADLQVLSPIMAIMAEHGYDQRRVMWYHETKKPVDGRYSEDQLLFAADMREAGIDVIGGGTDEAQAQLDRLNIRIPE